MSAVDFAARALALRASMIQPRVFADLCRLNLPSELRQVSSLGCLEPGVGAGDYVADRMANAALQDQHPNAVFQSGDQFYRLVPDGSGAVTPEQFGCPPYEPGVNAQPHINAAIRYAEAMSAAGHKTAVQFTQEKYEVWPPARVPSSAGMTNQPVPRGEHGNFTGIPFLITRRVELRAAPGGTTLIRKTNNGGDPAVFANWPVVNDNYGYGTFRGGLFGMVAQATRPANPEDRACPVMVGNWHLYGGIPKTNASGLHFDGSKYRLGTDGKGWDIYDKAFWYLSDWGGDYVGKLFEVHGYLKVEAFADITFFGGVMNDGLTVRGGLEICNSDTGGFDFGAYNTTDKNDGVDADFLWVHDVFLGMERNGGWNNRIGHLKIDHCDIAGSCMGGDYSEDDGDRKPVFHIGHLESSYNGVVAQGTHVFSLLKSVTVDKVTLVDTALGIGRSDQTYSCRDVRVDTVDAWADRLNNVDAVGFGASPTVSTHDCSVGTINCLRTAYAAANNKSIQRAVSVTTNPLGDRLFVGRITGAAAAGAQATGAIPAKAVGVYKSEHSINTGGFFWNAEATPALGNGYSIYQLSNTTANINQTVTLPAAVNYPPGSRIKLISRSNNAVFTIAITNTAMTRRAMLPANTNSIEFEQVNNQWTPVGVINKLVRSSTATLQKSGTAIPAGDVSDEATFTVNGARVGMSVRVTPNTAISGDAQLVGRVVADNTVGIRARNLNLGTTLALGSATYRVELEWAN